MKIHVYKTNRRIKESKYLIACKEYDGVLGNYEMYHQTDIDDILEENFYVDAGSNVKMWQGIADELNKPGVFDKLARYFKSKRVDRSGKPSSYICDALPVPHSHLEDDGESHDIRPDISGVKKK